MKLARYAVIVGAMALCPAVARGQQCSSSQTTITQHEVGTCSAPLQQLDGGEAYQVKVNTSCNDAGWATRSTAPVQISVLGKSQCNDTQTGGSPQCNIYFDTVAETYQGGGSWKFDARAVTRGWAGGTCQDGTEDRNGDTVNGQECTDTYCCGLKNDCQSVAGRDFNDSGCNCYGSASPILLDLGGNGFSLTSAEAGVVFDLDGSGERVRVAWTAAGSDDAFLVMDRDQNGRIDSAAELFGQVTTQLPSPRRNGFEALRMLDSNSDG